MASARSGSSGSPGWPYSSGDLASHGPQEDAGSYPGAELPLVLTPCADPEAALHRVLQALTTANAAKRMDLDWRAQQSVSSRHECLQLSSAICTGCTKLLFPGMWFFMCEVLAECIGAEGCEAAGEAPCGCCLSSAACAGGGGGARSGGPSQHHRPGMPPPPPGAIWGEFAMSGWLIAKLAQTKVVVLSRPDTDGTHSGSAAAQLA